MKNETRRVRPSGNEYYIDGNTVRRYEAAPEYTEAERRRQAQGERIEREKEEEQRRRRRVARRNQEKALRMSRSYVCFLTMAVAVFGVFAATYIKLQSDVTTRMSNIARLESQIADLKADNDEAYKRINTAIDIEGVKNTAMTELGMSYAKESQIIYYTVGDEDYMNQYSEIPGKQK